MRLALLIMLCWGGLLSNSPVWAQADAWSVEVAVTDRSPEEQAAAYKVALRRVLLSNSGDKTLLNRNDVREGLSNAESFVEEFRYRTPEPGTVVSADMPLTSRVRESGQATQFMLVRFDRTSVRELIDSAPRRDDSDEGEESKVPEPFTRVEAAIVWMLIEDDGRNIMISDPAAINVRERARELAGANGVSLNYPVGDAEDLAALGVEDITQRKLDRIRLASERYAPSVILIGQLRRVGARGWSSDWLRISGEVVEETHFTDNKLDTALSSGVAWLSAVADSGVADASYRYGGEEGSDTEGLVSVSSLDSTASYATIMNFLTGIPSVETVYPKEIREGGMVFAVLPRGALIDIASAVADQTWLRRASVSADQQGSLLVRNAELSLDYLR
ncbi:MAG: DUF2066 domain-containing protein [Granulosicoccus sp.]